MEPGGSNILFSCSPWSDSYRTSLPLCSCSWCGGIWLRWTRRKFCGLGRVCFSSSLPPSLLAKSNTWQFDKSQVLMFKPTDHIFYPCQPIWGAEKEKVQAVLFQKLVKTQPCRRRAAIGAWCVGVTYRISRYRRAVGCNADFAVVCALQSVQPANAAFVWRAGSVWKRKLLVSDGLPVG